VSGGRVDIGADELTCGNGMPDPGEQCDDGNPTSGDGCDDNCTITGCGNGVVTAGEQCDDGNVSVGDCCGATCQFESAGSACDDDDLCTNGDACDGAGECDGASAPAALCKGAPSGKGRLILRDSANPASDALTWKLSNADATSLVELGDPVGEDNYRLCVYDDAGGTQLRLAAAAPAGSAWKASTTSVTYRSQSGAPDGIRIAKLKTGIAGKAKLLVKGKGAALALPPLSSLVLPVTVQLRNADGTCWGATFSTPDAATATLFKARSD
jgi:cysteine-rich repeat protein